MTRRLIVAVCAPAVLAACSAAAPQRPATGSWRPLFDGTTLKHWKGYKTDIVPAGWGIHDGTLAKDARVGDLITRDEFDDFELELEWKIGRAGNSGIFYRGIEDPDAQDPKDGDRIYTTGPEYQLLDDLEAEDNKTRLTCAAANYGLYAAPAGHLKPVG